MLEAAYVLKGPIPAGTWNLVGDGIVAGDGVRSITVLFEVRLRAQGVTGDASDTIVVMTQNTFMRDQGNRFGAVAFEQQLQGMAVPAVAGDRLVLRITALRGDPGATFIPNGDGVTTGGRIPRLDLPVAMASP